MPSNKANLQMKDFQVNLMENKNEHCSHHLNRKTSMNDNIINVQVTQNCEKSDKLTTPIITDKMATNYHLIEKLPLNYQINTTKSKQNK